MTITQFNLLSFKPVVPLFSIYYSFLNIRPPKLVAKRLSDTYIHTYIYQSQNLTVASARNWRVCRQGRRGQGSRRQGRGRHGRTGQGRGTYQKRTEQKQSRALAKSRAGHDGHCAIWISKCAGQGQNAEEGKKGQNKVSRFGQL